MQYRSFSSCLAVLALALASGCPTTIPPAPRPDANLPDAGRDAAVIDADDLDASTEDANVDGGDIVDPGSCVFDRATDLYELATDVSDRPRTVGVGATPDGFGLSYAAFSGGFQQIWLAAIPSAGPPGGSMQTTMDFHTNLEPSVGWVDGAWTLAWFSNADGPFEIYTHRIGTDGRPADPRVRITNDLMRDDSVAMTLSADATRIAWVSETMAGARTAFTAAIDVHGALVGSPVEVMAPGRRPTTPTLVSRVGGYALAWGEDGDALIVPLSTAGAASAPIVLNAEGTGDASIDLTLGPTGGAAVFGTLQGGIRPEVHAILLDETGAPTGSERSLSIGTDTGRDASITALLGGYAVAYRGLDTNRLRVVFLSLTLDEVARLDLVDVSPGGGRTTIRTSGDGALIVAWSDGVGPTENHLRAARIRCN